MTKKKITPEMILAEHQQGWLLHCHQKIAELKFKEFDPPFYRFSITWSVFEEKVSKSDIINYLKENSGKKKDSLYLENQDGEKVYFTNIIFMIDGNQVSLRDYRANSQSHPIWHSISLVLERIISLLSKP